MVRWSGGQAVMRSGDQVVRAVKVFMMARRVQVVRAVKVSGARGQGGPDGPVVPMVQGLG